MQPPTFMDADKAAFILLLLMMGSLHIILLIIEHVAYMINLGGSAERFETGCSGAEVV